MYLISFLHQMVDWFGDLNAKVWKDVFKLTIDNEN